MRAERYEELQEKAFRLMEALSGVDEELLARSEEAEYPAARSGKRAGRTAFWQYGKYLAACFAFLVLGVSVYSVGRLTYDAGKSDGFTGGNAGGSFLNEFSVADSCAQAEDQAEVLTSYGEEGAGGENNAGMPGNMAISNLEAAMEDKEASGDTGSRAEVNLQSPLQSGATNKENAGNIDAMGSVGNASMERYEEAIKDNMLTLEEAEALTVVGEYVPEALPQGYRFANGVILREQEDGGYDIELSFQNAKAGDAAYIVLRITDCCVSAKAEGDAALQEQINLLWPDQKGERTFVAAENLTKDTFRTSGPVAVVYDSGVVVQYTGAGTPEEIYEMFRSIP